MARIRRSTLTPPGRKSGTITADMNSTVSSGTPRHSSMKPIDMIRMTGNCERRPSASRTPSGIAPATVTKEMITSSISPPHRLVSTKGKPKTSPTRRIPASTGYTSSSRATNRPRCRVFSRITGTAKPTSRTATRASRHSSFAG